MQLFTENYPLKPHNTFALEATARRWITFNTVQELRTIIISCGCLHQRWVVLGGGSNVILTDTFSGVFIHPSNDSVEFNGAQVVAHAGVQWDSLVSMSVERGLSGIENLSLIPGDVGAAPVQNIGAYGSEVGDVVEWVEFFDTETLSTERLSQQECLFGYRDSIFKQALRSRAIILRVALRLKQESMPNIGYGALARRFEGDAAPTLSQVRDAIIEIRRQKLPDPAVLGNAGSFFKNPVITTELAEALGQHHSDMPSWPHVGGGFKIPAAWLIQTAGWKGYRHGAVGVHEIQPLVLVNYGGATAQEILDLAQRIIDDVAQKFGITLQMEVNTI
ncbi:MAG: UDP-N-acetylmuramate dehydrogenase [Mucinivorans sp.]